jgi:cytochrome P450
MARMLYLLAQHPKVQDRLRRELDEALEHHDGETDFDVISSLPYLDAVMKETLRV